MTEIEEPKKRGPKPGSKRAPAAVQKVFVDVEYQGVTVPAPLFRARLNGSEQFFADRDKAREWVKAQRSKRPPKFVTLARNQYAALQKLDIEEIPAEKHEFIGLLLSALEELAEPYFDLKKEYTNEPIQPAEGDAASLLQSLSTP